MISSKIHTIRHLSKQANSSLLDAKRALDKHNWSYEAALDELAVDGQIKAKEKWSHVAESGIIRCYTHAGNQIAVMVEVRCETDLCARDEAFIDFVDKLAMQVAAMRPTYISRSDIDSALVAEKEESFTNFAKELGYVKDDETRIDHHVRDRMFRWYCEVCLLDQRWIHDPEKSVSEALIELADKLSEKIEIKKWIRWEIDNPNSIKR